MDKCFLQINPADNVSVAICETETIAFGHKKAVAPIKKGENVIKYGYPIGRAKTDIALGDHVHTHNLETNLDKAVDYTFTQDNAYKIQEKPEATFAGYRRKDGRVGIRNDIWIIPTVGCVNKTAEALAKLAREKLGLSVMALTHPYGCSQMGEDQESTQKTLAALARHPNAGAVLLLSLGCENNNLDVFLPFLGDYDCDRVATLVTQDHVNELSEGLALLADLGKKTAADVRVSIPQSELIIGFKCGGSDGFSGITANPLCGCITDLHTSLGGRAILTEVPEMFGAETILMNRCESKAVFDKTVAMINDFKAYYARHNQVVYENPSPGNKAGGITTLEEKSLGCVQKGGTAVVTDVLGYSQPCRKAGLSLLTGPGNDIVSCTNLTASGAHIILFTTGRGTPLGAPVPTLKIATGNHLANKKPSWVDFNGGLVLEKGMTTAAAQLYDLILDTANGQPAKNETNGYQEIAIFKNGVTL